MTRCRPLPQVLLLLVRGLLVCCKVAIMFLEHALELRKEFSSAKCPDNLGNRGTLDFSTVPTLTISLTVCVQRLRESRALIWMTLLMYFLEIVLMQMTQPLRFGRTRSCHSVRSLCPQRISRRGEALHACKPCT